jgi:hypothetical protein
MNFFTALLHLCQFVLPAVFVGGIVALLAPKILRIKTSRTYSKLMKQWFLNSLAGTAALAAGLWFYSVDGKMMTYALMVLCCAVVQWLQLFLTSSTGRK